MKVCSSGHISDRRTVNLGAVQTILNENMWSLERFRLLSDKKKKLCYAIVVYGRLEVAAVVPRDVPVVA